MWCCIALYAGGCGLRLAAGAAPHPASLTLHSPWWSCFFAPTRDAEDGAASSVPASSTTEPDPVLPDHNAAAGLPAVLTTLEALQPAGGGDASAPTASAGSRCYIAWLYYWAASPERVYAVVVVSFFSYHRR